jgi:hypothetical protein
MDGKATVHMGACARGGQTRGADQACAHALGCKEQDIPCGIVDEDTGQLYVPFGGSCKTSDGIVASLTAWWCGLRAQEQAGIDRGPIKRDKGSASSGMRTQFLSRMVQCAARMAQPIHRLYSPPSHSTYNPLERCWGSRELHWNGAQLIDVETMLEWEKRMTWKGLHPVVTLSRHMYQKGVSLRKAAMRAVATRLERNPLLPKWDILIRPVGAE